MTFESLLNTNIYLRTRASSQNDLGEWTYTYTNSSSPIPSRVVPVTDRIKIDYPGLYEDVNYICYCTSSASISKDSEITYNNQVFRVREVVTDSSFTYKKALLKKVV